MNPEGGKMGTLNHPGFAGEMPIDCQRLGESSPSQFLCLLKKLNKKDNERQKRNKKRRSWQSIPGPSIWWAIPDLCRRPPTAQPLSVTSDPLLVRQVL